ncbi:hypothetical protein [Primorskyibacter flagellatus]|uniref:Uncharacterized protein n=1 Tax=Primorskyibacter flagellatus TaxID=1387277 RepID=A0A1W1YUE0_9RHOB|nr:hypothetical protein [Primorskyibacter flagellatus]SMC39797.1 hypothetical protein SAMN06295998_1014 [Primorskyibacter flagellatus]
MDWSIDRLEAIGAAVATFEYWLGIATSVVIVFVHHRLKLPKLKVTGGSGGSKKTDDGKPFEYRRLSITNTPYFFGYPVSRDDFQVQSARIYDPEKRVYQGHLMRWQGEPENKPFKTKIPVGETAILYVYGLYEGRVHLYSGTSQNNIDHGETLVEVGQSRKLEIHITDIFRRRHRIAFSISAEERRNAMQTVQVHFRVKTTLSDRLQQVRGGVREVVSALTRPSY